MNKRERLAAEKAKTAALLKKVGYKGGSTYRAPIPDYSVPDNGVALSNTVTYTPRTVSYTHLTLPSKRIV